MRENERDFLSSKEGVRERINWVESEGNVAVQGVLKFSPKRRRFVGFADLNFQIVVYKSYFISFLHNVSFDNFNFCDVSIATHYDVCPFS